MAGAKFIADVICEEAYKVSDAVRSFIQSPNISLIDSMPTTIPSLRSIAKFALGSAQVALLPTNNVVLGGSAPTCPNAPLSCHNTTAQTNLCCFNAPGGQLLQTQFWDSDPATGPADSWTIHGLLTLRRPDHCDGSYSQYCDSTREYTNITQILQSYNQTALLDYMNVYWKNQDGTDESFWEHEWNKHGTCISTLDPDCYTNYTPQEEVVDFFNRVVSLFKTLDSYSFLAAANILPSTNTTYTFAQIQSALAAPRGVNAVFQCANGTQLDEIYYFYDVQGSVANGLFVPETPVGETSDCPTEGIQYLPKVLSSSTPNATSSTIISSSTGSSNFSTSLGYSVMPTAASSFGKAK